MIANHALYRTLDEVRAINGGLDEELRLQIGRMNNHQDVWPASVSRGAEWDAGRVLAHLSEFPAYFAGELARWHRDPDAPVGRDHTDAGRKSAVERAATVNVKTLINEVERSLVLLVEALNLLGDADVEALTRNRKYGSEPLRFFLDRYVLGHKAAHVDQLRLALDAELHGAGCEKRAGSLSGGGV